MTQPIQNVPTTALRHNDTTAMADTATPAQSRPTVPLARHAALRAAGAGSAKPSPLAKGLHQPTSGRELFGVVGPRPIDQRPKLDGTPRVYLAGAWGFFDFDAARPGYAPFNEVDASVANGRRGFVTLQHFEKAVEALGVQGTNPWTETLNDAFISGVMFGEGPDLDGKPWSHGSLKDHTMSRATLLHYLDELAKHPHAHRDRIQVRSDMTDAQVENIYREAVGDLIFSGNRAHVDEAQVVVANLNAYRGDADDGTVWETLWALGHGKRVIVIVDKDAPKALGEGIFGEDFRHNAMLAGELREAEQRGQAIIVHSLPDALAEIRRSVASTPRDRSARSRWSAETR